MSIRSRAAIVAGPCLALFAGEAAAQPPPGHTEVVAHTVRYAADELQSAAGARQVAARITYAADYVCGGDNVLLRSTARFLRCRWDAAERAVAELQAPLVTAALENRYTRVGAG